MSKAFKCDRCRGFSDQAVYNIMTPHGGYELCGNCKTKLLKFLNGTELSEDICSEVTQEAVDDGEDTKEDYEIKPLIYNSYSNHDCETWYNCPYCGKAVGSWSIYHQKREGKKPHCPHCKKVVDDKD